MTVLIARSCDPLPAKAGAKNPNSADVNLSNKLSVDCKELGERISSA